jgi:predicted nucleic acid-binding protein
VIVLDASALIEMLLCTRLGFAVARRIADPAVSLHAPALIDLEVVQALRRFEHFGQLSKFEARQALADLQALDLERHWHEPLLDRVWDLRANLTAYDAAYVALAVALDATLLTCDARLAGAPRNQAVVDVVD